MRYMPGTSYGFFLRQIKSEREQCAKTERILGFGRRSAGGNGRAVTLGLPKNSTSLHVRLKTTYRISRHRFNDSQRIPSNDGSQLLMIPIANGLSRLLMAASTCEWRMTTGKSRLPMKNSEYQIELVSVREKSKAERIAERQ